jgi:branched-chain amino acid transport system ATP-binding protein
VTMLLDVEDLKAGYGQGEVLHGVSFGVREHGITVLLGANGAGKTTTLRALTGMVRTRGSIRFGGKQINGARTEAIARAGIAHVPDGRGTFVGLTTEENLMLGAYTRVDRRAVGADLERVYGYFPRLRERRLQQAGTLSGGEQQMLAISRALMLRPRLMVLDEPSFGLAPMVVKEIFNMLGTINREEGLSLLLVEQNAAITLALSDHAYLLETGRIVIGGTAQEVRSNEAVRKSYLGY